MIAFKLIKKKLFVGLGNVDNYPKINETDRRKLYNPMHLNPSTPYGLKNKVQFDIRLYFCRRGWHDKINIYDKNG